MAFWHYTCDHGHEGIDGLVVPGGLVGTPSEVAWFTDLGRPIREALGLTSHLLSCDRTAYRYRVVDPSPLVPWVEVRRRYPWAAAIELAPGARPRHWLVATEPVAVTLDPISDPTRRTDP